MMPNNSKIGIMDNRVIITKITEIIHITNVRGVGHIKTQIIIGSEQINIIIELIK